MQRGDVGGTAHTYTGDKIILKHEGEEEIEWKQGKEITVM